MFYLLIVLNIIAGFTLIIIIPKILQSVMFNVSICDTVCFSNISNDNHNVSFVNRGTYYSDSQLSKLINITSYANKPKKLIILETRLDLLKYIKKLNPISFLYLLFSFDFWGGKTEGEYIPFSDEVYVFVFSQDFSDYSNFDKILYSTLNLYWVLRSRYEIITDDCCEEIDDFAANFVNKNSKKISEIMGWEDEWEVEEEN